MKRHHCCCCEDHCIRKSPLVVKLPTTPGSVIRSGSKGEGLFWVLEPDGRWYGRGATTRAAMSLEPARFIQPEVLFDAGAK